MNLTTVIIARLIEKIRSAGKFEDVVETSNWRADYKKLMLLIHPDVCSLPGASSAATKLNELKTGFEKGQTYVDESGSFHSNGYKTVFEDDSALLKVSFQNYNYLKSIGSSHFLKYLPLKMSLEGQRLVLTHAHRCVPLSNLQLSQEHVNWILSRMLEFTALISDLGYTHCGLTPESIFIVPETHGIQISSFYHLTSVGKKVSTISAKYKSWYPSYLFQEKIARPCIDIELCKKNAIYLLGDHSGSGIKLRKTHRAEFIDFVIAQSYDPAVSYERYRKILSKNFKKQFHILNL